MVRLDIAKYQDGVVLTIDGDSELILSPESFNAFARAIERADAAPVGHQSSHLFDPDEDDTGSDGYQERDVLASDEDY